MNDRIEMWFTKDYVESLNIAIDERLRKIKYEMEALQLEYNRLEITKMEMLKKLNEENNGK